jgi:anti-sigma B factor antagonist
MKLKVRKNQEIYIIDIQGELDLYSSYKLKDLLLGMLNKNIDRFILNLEDVDYIDSSGLGTLVFIVSTIKKRKYKLAFINLSRPAQRVLEITKSMGFFPVITNLEEAIKVLETG